MLLTKSRGNRSTGSGEEDFEGFFTIYTCRRGGHDLGNVTQIPRTNFVPPTHGGFTQNFASKRFRRRCLNWSER